MKQFKTNKILALLLSIIIIVSIMPLSVTAEEETISVTVSFDASVVADDLDRLYADLMATKNIGYDVTDVPSEIKVTVPSGSTVKEILEVAKETQNFTVVGLEDGYITQIGFIGSSVLENLVSIPVGSYSSGNVFASAGWGFYMNGESLNVGIGEFAVSENNAVIEAKYGLYTGWDNNWNAVHYDEIFLDAYNNLKELTEKTVDVSCFTQTEADKYNEEKANAEALLAEIYNNARLNENVSQAMKSTYEDYKTVGGMWIGYYEEKATSLWGTGSPTEQLENAAKELSDSMNPIPDNQLSQLVVTDLAGTIEDRLITFSRVQTEYVINDFTKDNLLPTFLKIKAISGTDSIVSVTLNGENVSLAELSDSWKKISGLDWENKNCNTLSITVTPSEGSVLKPTTYTVKLYRALTDVEIVLGAKEMLTWDDTKGLNDLENNVTSSLTLPASVTLKDNLGEAKVAWESSDTTLIGNDGKLIARPATTTEVTLTARISSGEAVDSKTFVISLLPVSKSELRNERISLILDNIAKSYVDKSSYWEAMDMGAYELYALQTSYKLTEKAKQKLINTAIKDVSSTDKDTDLSKAILALTAVGKDARSLYKVNSNTPISAIEKLNNATQSTSVWSAPYTLAAYNKSEYSSREKELILVNALLASQKDDGSWDEFGTIDTTANAISGLAFYMNDEDEELKKKVNTAINSAVTYLSEKQNADGTFSDSFSGRNSNSTAIVIVALSSVGIDLENDTFFIKNGNTILDGLLSFVCEDNSGIGFTDSSAISEYSTEQGFRAFIAAMQAIKTEKAYNIYDFSGLSLTPAREKSESSGGTVISSPSGDEITVNVTIKTEKMYWLKNYRVTIPGTDATVYHAFVKACEDNNISQVGADKGYVFSMTKGNETLSEFSNGADSGWLYKVNDKSPLLGIKECDIKNGDSIVWYYTNDYNLDKNSSGWKNPTPSKLNEEKNLSEEKTEETKPTESLSQKKYNDTKGHWAEKSISYMSDLGFMKGTDENNFSPETKLSRGMFITVLYRIAGEPKADKQIFSDVNNDDYFAPAVAWASENKLVSGVSENEFAPNLNISREELAVILYRYAQYMNLDITCKSELDKFQDGIEVSVWADDALSWAINCGLIKGRSETILAPKENTTRAEAAEVFVRYIEAFNKMEANKNE